MAIVTRTGLGRPLKHNELDNNFVEIVGALNQLDERLDEFAPDTPNGLLDLTNENINIPTDSDGNNPDLDNASTFVNLYINGESLADTVGGYVAGSSDLAIEIEQSWQISGELTNCVGNWVKVENSPINQFEITSISADYAEVKFTASNTSYTSDLVSFLRLNKVKAAADGTPATVFSVKASHNAIVRNKDNSFSPATIDFTGYKAIGNNEPSQSDVGFLRIFIDKGIGFSNPSTTPNGITETGYAVEADDEFIRAIFYSGTPSTSEVYLDSETIPVITDGNDAIIVRLSNENHSLPADKDGNNVVTDGCGTNVRVYQGGYELDYDSNFDTNGNNGTYKVSAALSEGSGLTVSIPNSSSTNPNYIVYPKHAITDGSSDVFVIEYTVTGKTRDGKDFTATVDQTLTKNKQGAPAVVVNLSNDTHTIPVDNGGNPYGNSFNEATTTFRVYEAGEIVTSDWDVSISNSNVTQAKVGEQDPADSHTVSVTDMSADVGRVTFTATKDGATIQAVFTLSKVYAGGTGAAAVVYRLVPSAAVIKSNGEQAPTLTPSSITFSKYKLTGGESPTLTSDGTVYVYKNSTSGMPLTLNTSDSTKPVLYSIPTDTTYLTVVYEVGGVEVDRETIPVVVDGTDGDTGPQGPPALNIYLTKSNHNVYAYNYNDFIPDAFADANGIITVYAGDTKLIPVYNENTYNNTYISNANYYLIQQDTNDNVLAASLGQGNFNNRQSTYSVTGFQDKTQSSASLKFNIKYLNDPYEAFFNLTKVEAGLKTSTYLSRYQNELNDIAFDENNGELLQLKDYVFSGHYTGDGFYSLYGKLDSNPNLLYLADDKYRSLTGWNSFATQTTVTSDVVTKNNFYKISGFGDIVLDRMVDDDIPNAKGVSANDNNDPLNMDLELNESYCLSVYYLESPNPPQSSDFNNSFGFRILYQTGESGGPFEHSSIGCNVTIPNNGQQSSISAQLVSSPVGPGINYDFDFGISNEYIEMRDNFKLKRAWFSFKPTQAGLYQVSKVKSIDIYGLYIDTIHFGPIKFEKSSYPTDFNDTENGTLNFYYNLQPFVNGQLKNSSYFEQNFTLYDYEQYEINFNDSTTPASYFKRKNFNIIKNDQIVFKIKKLDGTSSQYEPIWIPINSVPDPNRIKRISAEEIAANAITADKILAGSITAAKMSVTDLSSISANIGTVTAGKIRDASNNFRIELDNGLSVLVKGGYAKVSGIGFGQDQNLIEWFGPVEYVQISETSLDVSNCSEANAQYYINQDGVSFFGTKTIFAQADISRTVNDSGTYNSTSLIATIGESFNVTNSSTIKYSLSYSFSSVFSDFNYISDNFSIDNKTGLNLTVDNFSFPIYIDRSNDANFSNYNVITTVYVNQSNISTPVNCVVDVSEFDSNKFSISLNLKYSKSAIDQEISNPEGNFYFRARANISDRPNLVAPNDIKNNNTEQLLSFTIIQIN